MSGSAYERNARWAIRSVIGPRFRCAFNSLSAAQQADRSNSTDKASKCFYGETPVYLVLMGPNCLAANQLGRHGGATPRRAVREVPLNGRDPTKSVQGIHTAFNS